MTATVPFCGEHPGGQLGRLRLGERTMNALEVFRFDGADVRTVVIDDQPWFVAKDACNVLGIVKYRDATTQLDSDERASAVVDTLGGRQQMAVVSESGLFTLMLISRSPKVRAFRRWVTSEVLPTIRRTGTYTMAPILPEDEIVQQALAITALRVERLEFRVAEPEPVAAHAETFRQADGLRTIGDLANDFKAHYVEKFPDVKVKHQDVWDHASRLGIFIRTASVRHNQPTAQAIESGWARAHRTTFGTNTRGQQIKVNNRLTPKGEAHLWDGLAAWLGTHGTLTLPN